MAEPWVRERYYMSSGPDAGDLDPYGQALLSRWPLALELHPLSAKKRLLVGRLSLGGRRSFSSPCTPLSTLAVRSPAGRAP